MNVTFYYNASDSRVVNKRLIQYETFSGQARDDVDKMEPVILFDKSNRVYGNYAYIEELGRYYYVTNINHIRQNLTEVSFSVDVLMSFRNDIHNMNAVVDKQSMISNGDEYIDDGSLVAENVMFQTVYNYPSGFNSTGEYILITAG